MEGSQFIWEVILVHFVPSSQTQFIILFVSVVFTCSELAKLFAVTCAQGTQCKVVLKGSQWRFVLIWPTRKLNHVCRSKKQECLPLDHLGGYNDLISSNL